MYDDDAYYYYHEADFGGGAGTGTFLAVAPLCMWDCAVTLAFLLSLMLIALLDAPRHTRRPRMYWVLAGGVLVALSLAIAIEFASRVPQMGSLSLLAEYVRAHPLFAFALTTETPPPPPLLPSSSWHEGEGGGGGSSGSSRGLPSPLRMREDNANAKYYNSNNNSGSGGGGEERQQQPQPQQKQFVAMEVVSPDADTEAALLLAQAGAPSLWPFMLLAAVSPLLLRAGGGGVLSGGLYHTMSPSQTLETGIPVNGLLAGLVLSWFSPLENALVHTHALVNRGNCLAMVLVVPPALAATLALLLHSLRCRTSLVSVTVLTFAVMVRQQCAHTNNNDHDHNNNNNEQRAGGAALDVLGLCVASLCLLLALWLVCRTTHGLAPLPMMMPMSSSSGGGGGGDGEGGRMQKRRRMRPMTARRGR